MEDGIVRKLYLSEVCMYVFTWFILTLSRFGWKVVVF